jgi:hypothetical protein
MSRDSEGIDIPRNGLADLVNARASSTEISGRPGTELVTPADWGVEITDNTETLSVAIQSGELYAAEGREKDVDSVPALNSIFMVYGSGDTSSDTLAAAKGSAPRMYDLFKITNNGVGTETVSFLGSIKLPMLEGFGDTVATEITASKSGYTITWLSGPKFTADLVNQYFVWGDGENDYISAFVNDTTLTCLYSQTKTSTAKCGVRGRINSSWYHQSQKKLVLFIRQKLYCADNVPWTTFTEIYPHGYYSIPDDSFCKMYEFDKDLILINSAGQYRIKLDTLRYWRINDSAPEYADRPADDAVATDFVDADPMANIEYRYLYSFSRIINTVSFVNNRTHVDSTLEWQSGPTKPDGDGRDYFVKYNSKNTGSGNVSYGAYNEDILVHSYLTAGSNFGTLASTKEISDGVFSCTIRSYKKINGVISYTDIVRMCAQIDFTDAENIDDCAEKIEDSLNTTWKDLNIKFQCGIRRSAGASTVKLQITTSPGCYIYAMAIGTGGTDILTNIGFSATTYSPVFAFWPMEIGPLTIPEKSRSATHITVWRTKRVGKAGLDLGNNPNLFIFVEDVPLINVLDVAISASTALSVNTGTLKQLDYYSTILFEDGETNRLFTVNETNNAGTIVSAHSSTSSIACAIGANDVFRASITSNTMTIVGNYFLSSDDVGKPVFFASGEIRWIVKILTNATATMSSGDNIASTAAAMNPSERYFSDTVFDELYVKDPTHPNLDSRIKSHTLPTRFSSELPNTNLGIVVPGWLIVAEQGKNKFYYSDTAIEYLAGSYASDLQYNDKIDGSIQEFIRLNDFVGIRTEFSTWRLNLATVIDLGDQTIGENFDGFNDPEIADNSIGVEGEQGTAMLENGNFFTFTSEPSVREFDMYKYGANLAHDLIQESDIQVLEPRTILFYDHIAGLFVWGKK